jgi:hypothetical protein
MMIKKILSEFSVIISMAPVLLLITSVCANAQTPDDIVIGCDPEFSKSDYIVEAYTSLADTDKYVTDRGADKGLIEIPCLGKKMKSLIFPKEQIEKVIKVTYKESVFDKTDFIFTGEFIFAVCTSIANAGIFTYSDVYIIPQQTGGLMYRTLLELPGYDCIPAEIKTLFFCVLNYDKRNHIN